MRILVFIGPSGSGKSTLIRELNRRGVVEVMPSWTTRPQRQSELGEGLDHHFVGEAEFNRLEEAGFFLETVEMFGFRYGLPEFPTPQRGPIPTIVVRAPLLELVAKHFPDHRVYQAESDLETMSTRLQERRQEEDVLGRLASYASELALGRERAHRIFDTGGRLEDVVRDTQQAIEEDFHIEEDFQIERSFL